MTPLLKLVLMRHGHALGVGLDPGLTGQGVRAIRLTLERRDSWPEGAPVLHSPLCRARQTAALVGEALDARLLQRDELIPQGDATTAASMIVDVAMANGGAVVISHLPLLPALHCWLVDEHRDFEPAAAVLLQAPSSLAWRGGFAPFTSDTA